MIDCKFTTYPEVHTETKMYQDNKPRFIIQAWTKLRLFHLGKWYYQKFYQKYEGTHIQYISDMHLRLHKDIYLSLHFAQVDIQAKDVYGNLLWEICEDQIDESKRLLKTIQLK